jgi:hypothetical protein
MQTWSSSIALHCIVFIFLACQVAHPCNALVLGDRAAIEQCDS